MSELNGGQPPDRVKRGAILVGVAIAIVAIVSVGSAVTAPERGVAGDEETATLVGIQGEGVGLHKGGRVAMYDESGDVSWELQNADSYFDVTRLDDGRVLAGFVADGYEECGPYDAPCTHTGFRILDPDAADPVVDEYSYPVRTWQNSETHDVERLSSGNYLITDMEHEAIRIVDIDADETVWQWNASSFYEAPPDPTRRDWLHVNDVDVIDEGRYLVSVRNANQLLVVERGEGVVRVVNEDGNTSDRSCLRDGMLYDADGDGDVRCGNADLFRGQHNPQWLDEDAVLVADSEQGRIVELHYGETSNRWHVVWQLDEANDIQFRWPRDADRLPNGNTLITDSGNARVVEVTENGTTVWSAALPDNPYEAERLPHNEPVGGSRYSAGATGSQSTPTDVAEEPDDGGIPLLTPLLSLLTTSMNVPHWFTELHVGVVFVSLGMALVGTWDLVRGIAHRRR